MKTIPTRVAALGRPSGEPPAVRLPLMAGLAVALGAMPAWAGEVTFGPEGARLGVLAADTATILRVPNGVAIEDGDCAMALATGRLRGLPLQSAAMALAGALGQGADTVTQGAAMPDGSASPWQFRAGAAHVLLFEVEGRYVMVARTGDETKALSMLATLRGMDTGGSGGDGRDAAPPR